MARQRDVLPRLNIPASLNMQQPMQAMYSPALPTSIQQGFHAPLPMQTPMQPYFNPHMGPPTARPIHHAAHASMAQLAAAGIHPPNGFPITPLGGGHFPRPSMQMNGPPHGRNRRQLSVGGPPKAVLGGPQRKLSPLPPPTAAAATSPSPAPPPKKKMPVNLPKETIRAEDGSVIGHAPWARLVADAPPIPPAPLVQPVETNTKEAYPADGWRYLMPSTVDVFLPGKSAWDTMRQMAIEEKLEKLGVERGEGSVPPQLYAPHGRAASISSPADPALLLFKLNKLQQSQHASATNSLSSSPLYGMSPSPNLQPRHGHSLSLAQPPTHSLYPGPSINPFGHNAVLGSDSLRSSPHLQAEIFAPQGRVPVPYSSLAPPSAPSSTSDSRPDFTRGFGLDIPEEEEEDEEDTRRMSEEGESEEEEEEEDANDTEPEDGPSGGTATANSQHHHSRHASKLSAALSLRSFGVFNSETFNERTDIEPAGHDTLDTVRKHDLDGVEEWTGSEDVFMGQESSDDESIGEWSNPSDEERARQHRVERRMHRKAMQQEDAQPRRIPNFPRPPDMQHDDDIISNPSDEGHHHAQYLTVRDYYDGPSSNSSSRPLPALPHSRLPSGHSLHDPAHAHSPQHSDVNFGYAEPLKPALPRLNPNAKPFVFGATRAPFTPTTTSNTHSRAPSFGKPLNVSAPEFKPGSFTFKFPTANPIFPVAEPYQPIPEPPVDQSSPFRTQGREKRPRHDSFEDEDQEEGDSFTSFKFPSTNANINKNPSPRPPLRSGHSSLNPSAEPFTFAGFSAAATLPTIRPRPSDEDEANETAQAEYGDSHGDIFSVPPGTKSKRAPIPLDFKHTVSNNTVPAGLFKALANNPEERTRRNVRSRMSSREVFEHLTRPSLDDLNVPAISHKVSRTRLVTDPGRLVSDREDDVFSGVGARHARRRSSLPDALHSPTGSGSSMSEESYVQPLQPLRDVPSAASAMDLNRFEDLLDEKLAALRRDMRGGSTLNPNTEAMINEVVTLFRSQLRDTASKSFEDSQMDARGELDFQLIRGVIEEGHAETLAHLRRELGAMASSIGSGAAPGMEHYSGRIVEAIRETISELSVRLESITTAAPARERDAIVDSVISSISPLLGSERVDYDFLTEKLTQAVKPHISQLIDLASDKRETANLIVDRLVPILLPRMQAQEVDTDAISRQLVSAVTRAIAPIDAFEIKEQVADLVVERLDARLANRDKAFSVEGIVEKVGRLLEERDRDNVGADSNAELGGKVVAAVRDVEGKVLSAITAFVPKAAAPVPDANILHVKGVVDSLSRSTIDQSSAVMELQREVLDKIGALPDAFAIATHVLQDAHAEFTLSRDTVKRELEDLRKANTEFQVQVAKARGAHGQIRVEKDVLSEKLGIVEADRDRLRAQMKEMHDGANVRAEENAAVVTRNVELQDALAKALARLQSSDVATAANQARIVELEKANQDLLFEKRTFKTKTDNLEVKAAYASRDKEISEQTIATLRKEKAELVAQAGQWDNLRKTSEQLQHISALLQQSDDAEMKDLKRVRDRSKVLEGEHSALQKRFKEQEARVSNNDKAAFTARQSLSQAQQRSSEWEKRAKEYEGKLEMTRTQLEQAEQTQIQLDADYQVVKMQLEEREADDRLSKDRESKLKDQVTALESKIRVMQAEFEKARSSNTTPLRAPLPRNGYSVAQPRPDSRASTAYDRSRSVTPNGQAPPTSVYDSIHAPKAKTNGYGGLGAAQPSRYPGHLSRVARAPFNRAQAPSPTPSTVSLAPTVDNDGWWS